MLFGLDKELLTRSFVVLGLFAIIALEVAIMSVRRAGRHAYGKS